MGFASLVGRRSGTSRCCARQGMAAQAVGNRPWVRDLRNSPA